MGPRERVWIGLAILLASAVGFAAGRVLLRPERRVVQPIAFNHATHTEILDCESCHQFYGESAHSGLPDLTLCMECHEEPLTESPEEELIRELTAAGETHVFRKLFRLPDHVYYSHRRHVGVAEIPCETCHGAIAASLSPPERPLVRIDMDFCLDCHAREDVSADCTRCHR